MDLIRATVTREIAPGRSQTHVKVETTPVGSALLGVLGVWLGYRMLRNLRRRWWLPIGMGLATLAYRQFSSTNSERVVTKEDR